jgi:molecular chaperone GrpE
MDDKKTNSAKQNKDAENKDKNEESEQGETVHLKQEIEELENRVKRIFADYQNLEKRAAQEKRDLILNSNKQLLLRLMPVLDTLMFALEHTKDKGVELAIKQFADALAAEGVRKIETKDKMFDPKLMECIAVEVGEEGKVVSEVTAGYMLNEEVLRPAMVKVGSQNAEQKKNIEKETEKVVN